LVQEHNYQEKETEIITDNNNNFVNNRQDYGAFGSISGSHYSESVSNTSPETGNSDQDLSWFLSVSA
jgi:hypothetical protein